MSQRPHRRGRLRWCVNFAERLLFAEWDDANIQLAQLLIVDRSRCFGHHVGGFLRFWERNAVSNAFQLPEQHHKAIDSQGDAAMGRGSELVEG